MTKTQEELYDKIITCIEGFEVGPISAIEVLALVINYYLKKLKKK